MKKFERPNLKKEKIITEKEKVFIIYHQEEELKRVLINQISEIICTCEGTAEEVKTCLDNATNSDPNDITAYPPTEIKKRCSLSGQIRIAKTKLNK